MDPADDLGDERSHGQRHDLGAGLGLRQRKRVRDVDALDALVDKAVAAQTQGALDNTCRALDRVLRSGRYWIPHWNKASHWIAYWDQFGFPSTKPRNSRGAPDTWWYDPAKAAKIEQAK